MNSDIKFLGRDPRVEERIFDCLIVGSGAAAYNAALHLYDRSVTNIAIVTEDRLAGTSRNTGSDKQTYYKIACSGDEKDSPRAMAETLFAGASMDGDLALCEASHSLEEFFHLVSLGVEFPHNRYGEYAGYKTDHDPLQRASSIGPYTSKRMTECLEQAAMARNIEVIDKCRVIKILTRPGNDPETKRAYGFLCLKNEKDYGLYFSKNIIFASGGPPGLYGNTVYPVSQFGSSGILAREGVVFSNLSEWQYGIGSVKFRWNLSGSYQQVIPRYVSVDPEGREEEFLSPYFSSLKKRDRAVFLKGYQWPFDPAKIIDPGADYAAKGTSGEGSSIVDLAIYIEKQIKGRRVYLDYMQNPQGFVLDEIDRTSREYLEKSGALCPTPLERLLRLNQPSYELYKNNGIDLAKEYLEIDVHPQHQNGGAEVNIWWETSVKHLFAIGECAGTHGVHRPGGSALNSGQVGGLRAASYIAGHSLGDDPFYEIETLKTMALDELEDFEKDCFQAPSQGTDSGTSPRPGQSEGRAEELLEDLQKINLRSAAFIRSRRDLEESREKIKALADKNLDPREKPAAFFRFKEMLLLTRLLHDGILSYIKGGGKSRGSYLVLDAAKDIEACLRGVEIDRLHWDKVLNSFYIQNEDRVISSLRQVRPIPDSDTWFEKVWQEYREGALFKDSNN